jgi:hypothetical protein
LLVAWTIGLEARRNDGAACKEGEGGENEKQKSEEGGDSWKVERKIALVHFFK